MDEIPGDGDAVGGAGDGATVLEFFTPSPTYNVIIIYSNIV
jgi:hypothetical protein